MISLAILLFAASLLTPSLAQTYTIWSSVVFVRSGDRSPLVLGSTPTSLTALGAQQLYSAGHFFRSRYLIESSSNSTYGLGYAPIQGLEEYVPSDEQLYILALDESWAVASAQAFMQGFYPPSALNTSAGATLDPANLLSNGSYIDTPFNGYQYPHIHVGSDMDPNSIYVGGSIGCPALEILQTFAESADYDATRLSSQDMYDTIGHAFLNGVLDESGWTYGNAYNIYDYMNYQNIHNSSASVLLNSSAFRDPSTSASYMDMLRWYADAQEYANLGNLSAKNPYGRSSQSATTGTISTIAGSTLAAKMLDILLKSIDSGSETYKLSLLFGGFDAFVSFFALTSLPSIDPNFYGLPDYGSSLVLELFSWTNGSLGQPASSPPVDALWVRFYFRNGTDVGVATASSTAGAGNDAGAILQAYPLFARGPDESDMPLADFIAAMEDLIIADVGDWCAQCGATNLFCAAWNLTDGFVGGTTGTNSASSSSSRRLDPAIAGVIGALVTLALVAMLVAALMLVAGLRFHHVDSSRGSDIGGFKSGRKMRSDEDLVLPKGAAMGGVVESKGSDDVGHGVAARERVGSWELNDSEPRKFGALASPGLANTWQPKSFELNRDEAVDEDGFTKVFTVAERV